LLRVSGIHCASAVHALKYGDRSLSATLKAVDEFYAASHENAKAEVR